MHDPLALDVGGAPEPDAGAGPEGFVVIVEPGDRVHFLDWGSAGSDARPGVLLVHGIAQTAWIWTPVARRLRRRGPTVAMDLRGHGLSDAPTTGYDRSTLAEDLIAVAEGSGLLGRAPVVLAGHGFGAVVAAWAAAVLGDRCAGLVLVDGGWEDMAAATGLEPDEFVRTVDEPPEVLASMDAFLADREAFDPGSWDADQERAARATVVETAAGRLVPVTRPHALAGAVEALFAYRPSEVLAEVSAPILVLAGPEDDGRTRGPALARVQSDLAEAGRPPIRIAAFPRAGHNLMRYHPAEVSAAMVAVAEAGTG